MKTVTVRYFAALREAAGTPEEHVETYASSLGDLYGELRDRHGFKLEAGQIKASRNLDWTPLDAPVSDGDSVVFIPPVAGG